MLEFFRKYQWYFFLVITVVIVISFSFFGTYSAVGDKSGHDEVAFIAVDGTKIPRSELDETVLFLGTDAQDKMALGGVWGPNFLNDGVIVRDFLGTGLADILAEYYRSDIEDELRLRHEKEKRYVAYMHPQAHHAVSAESVWAYFAPQIKSGIDTLKKAEDSTAPEAFRQRVALFLAEKQFPSSTLRQVLRYQQKQYSWVTPDQDLDYRDLSLFGYHTLDDWFGPRFVKFIAQFIINAAKVAENRGYRVTKEEAIADLARQVNDSYQQATATNKNIGVASREEFYNEQLRRMGIDQSIAVRIWKQVLLFRRLFHDQGNSVFVDALPFQQLNSYAKQSVDADLYRLPAALRLNNFRDLQRLEIYLKAVANGSAEGPLSLPKNFLAVEDIAKKYPELVQKRYILEVAEVDKGTLQTRVPIKEMWAWEVQDGGWNALKQAFPELGVKSAKNREERFALLDALDQPTRSRIDLFARKAIVNEHPEWLATALQEAQPKKITAHIRLKGGATPFAGVADREELIRLLDQGDPARLKGYTADENKYYNITLIEKGPRLEILTFAEASKGALDPVVKRILDAYYVGIRHDDVATFQKADGSWKGIDEVQDEVANRYLKGVLKAIHDDYRAVVPTGAQPLHELNGDFLATVRLYHYMRDARDAVVHNKATANNFYHEPEQTNAEDAIVIEQPLAHQWLLEKTPYHATLDQENKLVDSREIFALAAGGWSTIQTPLNGDLAFVQVKQKGVEETNELAQQMQQAQRELSADAQRTLMRSILKITQPGQSNA